MRPPLRIYLAPDEIEGLPVTSKHIVLARHALVKDLIEQISKFIYFTFTADVPWIMLLVSDSGRLEILSIISFQTNGFLFLFMFFLCAIIYQTKSSLISTCMLRSAVRSTPFPESPLLQPCSMHGQDFVGKVELVSHLMMVWSVFTSSQSRPILIAVWHVQEEKIFFSAQKRW